MQWFLPKSCNAPANIAYPQIDFIHLSSFRALTRFISMEPVFLPIDDLRDQYAQQMALVRQTWERTGDGTAAIRRRSSIVDRLLIELWRRALSSNQNATDPAKAAMLALGGYGRKDLFPCSDIDVLFAFSDEEQEKSALARRFAH